MTAKPIRVLVVDDSALMRKLISRLVERDETIHVVGTAMDGEFALKKIEELMPDVVTLDLDMPRLNGIDTLRQIMRHPRVPVIVVSAHSQEGASLTFKALHMGAFDFVPKPEDVLSDAMTDIADELIVKIKAAAGSPVERSRRLVREEKPRAPRRKPLAAAGPADKVVAIGISTGGPNSLEYMLSHLPAEFAAGILVVQHMPVGFTAAFARRLNESCALEVKEAQSGDVICAGRVLICPGDRHMRVHRASFGNTVVLNDDPRVRGHRPSVDVLFHSVATEFGRDAVGVLMTGMGEDGADGLGAMHHAGAVTIAQDEESSVVFGMPRAAIERGYATRVLSLEAIASSLIGQCGLRRPLDAGELHTARQAGHL